MYKSKQLISAHGRLKMNVIFTMNNKEGSKFVETGYSQSVNVARHHKQMFDEAILNAFYKLNHRRGERIFTKKNYNEDLREYVKSLQILSYSFDYYEDRRYSYKRESRDGKYKNVTYRDGEEHKVEDYKRLTPKGLNKISDESL